jgi:hypothetical protein
VTARLLIAGALALVVGCRGASEAELIRRRLESEDRMTVQRAVFAAQHLREQDRKAGRPTPTGDKAALVRDLVRLLATSTDFELKTIIAGSFMMAPVPGPQPELLACGRNQPLSIASRCLWAIGDEHDPANLGPLVDMLIDPTIAASPDNVERFSAVSVAIRSYDAAAIPYLARVVRTGDAGARVLALWGLFSCARDGATGEAAEAALPALSDPDPNINYVAIEVVKLDPGHREALRPFLTDPREWVRRTAQHALEE